MMIAVDCRTEFILTPNGDRLFLRRWLPDGSPAAVIQLCHGMAEHSGVYDEFVQAMLKRQFAVYAHDHRGHGKTVSQDGDYGHFESKTGWQQAVDDVSTVSRLIKNETPAPLFIFGHSMGSFLVRQAIQKDEAYYQGAILSGTGTDPGWLGRAGRLIAGLEKKLRGAKCRSPFMNALAFGNFNSHFKPTRTQYDWLSTDPDQVDHYVNDPLCGFICTTSFYHELLKGLIQVNQPEAFYKTPRILPVYLFSGEQDPVGDMGKGVQEVYEKFRKRGISDLTLKLYPGGRHEMLHEVNRQEVYADLGQWIGSRL